LIQILIKIVMKLKPFRCEALSPLKVSCIAA